MVVECLEVCEATGDVCDGCRCDFTQQEMRTIISHQPRYTLPEEREASDGVCVCVCAVQVCLCSVLFSVPLLIFFKAACAVNETWRQVLRCRGNRRKGQQQGDVSGDCRCVCVLGFLRQ